MPMRTDGDERAAIKIGEKMENRIAREWTLGIVEKEGSLSGRKDDTALEDSKGLAGRAVWGRLPSAPKNSWSKWGF